MTTSDPLTMAEHWLDVGNPQRCLDTLDESSLGLDVIEAYELRSLALIRVRRPEDAYIVAVRGIELEPDNAALHYYAAQAADAADNMQDADRHFRQALSLQPGDVTMHARYGSFLVDAKRLAEADRQIALAHELDPESHKLTLLRGEVAVAREDWDRARHLAQQILAEEPDDPEALQLDGMAALGSGDVDAAADRLGRAAALTLGNASTAAQARAVRLLQKPWMWPVRFADRTGWKFWVVCIVVGQVTVRTAPAPYVAIFGGIYLTLFVYVLGGSLIVGRIARRSR